MLDFFAAIRSQANKDGLYQYSNLQQADILTASVFGGRFADLFERNTATSG